jgi:GNAT superfamily N-acetyltransferase
VVLVAVDGPGNIVGTVQLILDLPENQPHRADLAKMLVHRRARHQGVGAALLVAAEECARERGRTLLVLDTASPDARRLYERGGWQRVGVVPGFALYPDGRPCATTFYFKALEDGLSAPAAP